MGKKFKEYKGLNLSQVNENVLEAWKQNKTFEQSIETREGKKTFVFYEGPPSANGMPGIHHVMARTIKDIFCRYKTQKGYLVHRKAGWDTHGLPVELGVEKKLNITKEDIGKSISIEKYNKECREEVMKYTKQWEDLTTKMGYWVDMKEPYITYDSRYMESLWWLLKKLFDKNLLYKGYTIQPYSPAAGTGLSSHELNQPGCYRDVKDTTVTAQFKIVENESSAFLFKNTDAPVYFLAWTTTPWTLPSNTALAVGPNITYTKVRTFNPYTGQPTTLVLAKDLFNQHFNQKNADLAIEDYKVGDKKIPFKIIEEYKGIDLENIAYEQLIPWVKPMGNAFKVILGDYVTTEDGTGIVHIAPTFGADDDRVAKAANIAPLHLIDRDGDKQPMVDRTGKFYKIEELEPNFIDQNINSSYKEYEGRFVKNEYDPSLKNTETTLDIDIAVMLKKENKAFKVEKHVHNYPHCWRTDKPVLYYPLDSWFIKATDVKNRMIELNSTINWKPESTGTGRFGKWLENLNDWNLSRSRFWGTPLPIWRSEDKQEIICIGSTEELISEINKAVEAGVMEANPFPDFKPGDNSKENYEKIDLHKHYVDGITLIKNGKKLYREPDLIDVWFDSGAMPYAQMHHPFENKEKIDSNEIFPADFIAEGVDQTRGWFYTLHAISCMVKDSVAFKNIISNGLVLDKDGNKMSKRLGNAVDPFEVIKNQGSDPLRWYMVTNASPWDNLKFDINGIDEVKRKFFGTAYNTYSFFSLYANVDNFTYTEKEIPVEERPEIDRWVISLLNSLIKEVEAHYENYEPTKAGRAIQEFVMENLSNWYVRLNRKRYWGGEYDKDKIAAYQTLYTCLETVSKLAAPIAPFFMDQLFCDLNTVSKKHEENSVHLASFPSYNESLINKKLEEKMDIAQKISSMILSLRRKVSIKVRQPLNKIMIPVIEKEQEELIKAVENIILSEVNVKNLELITDTSGVIIKKIKPNFKLLGKKFGKTMKQVSGQINQFTQENINEIEKNGVFTLNIEDQTIELKLEEVEITSEDIPGWLVVTEGKLTVALDINITEELRYEGIAREFINRIQNIRKESGFDVTDKVDIKIQMHEDINKAIEKYKNYIGSQTLASSVELTKELSKEESRLVEIDDISTLIKINKES